jgi:hypothetical protein
VGVPGVYRRVHFYAPIAEQRQPEAGHRRAKIREIMGATVEGPSDVPSG